MHTHTKKTIALMCIFLSSTDPPVHLGRSFGASLSWPVTLVTRWTSAPSTSARGRCWWASWTRTGRGCAMTTTTRTRWDKSGGQSGGRRFQNRTRFQAVVELSVWLDVQKKLHFLFAQMAYVIIIYINAAVAVLVQTNKGMITFYFSVRHPDLRAHCVTLEGICWQKME